MRYAFTFLLLHLSFSLFAQVDTIYTGREKIACSIKEVTPDAVQFTYSGETMTNTLYKNTIQRIIFRSGRVQTFSESMALPQITGIEDYPKVVITQVEGETKGLYKIGEVSASSRGGSIYSNIDKVKERTMSKLKMEAVMRGANLVYMAYQKTDGNHYGGYFSPAKAAESIYSGVAYSSMLPNKDEFSRKLGSMDQAVSDEQIVLLKGTAITKAEYTLQPRKVNIGIRRVYDQAGQLYLDALVPGYSGNAFRVVRYDDKSFVLLAEDKNKLVNLYVPFK